MLHWPGEPEAHQLTLGSLPATPDGIGRISFPEYQFDPGLESSDPGLEPLPACVCSESIINPAASLSYGCQPCTAAASLYSGG